MRLRRDSKPARRRSSLTRRAPRCAAAAPVPSLADTLRTARLGSKALLDALEAALDGDGRLLAMWEARLADDARSDEEHWPRAGWPQKGPGHFPSSVCRRSERWLDRLLDNWPGWRQRGLDYQDEEEAA